MPQSGAEGCIHIADNDVGVTVDGVVLTDEDLVDSDIVRGGEVEVVRAEVVIDVSWLIDVDNVDDGDDDDSDIVDWLVKTESDVVGRICWDIVDRLDAFADIPWLVIEDTTVGIDVNENVVTGVLRMSSVVVDDCGSVVVVSLSRDNVEDQEFPASVVGSVRTPEIEVWLHKSWTWLQEPFCRHVAAAVVGWLVHE